MFVIVVDFRLNNYNIIRPGVPRLLTASDFCGSRYRVRRAERPKFQSVYGRKKLSFGSKRYVTHAYILQGDDIRLGSRFTQYSIFNNSLHCVLYGEML